MEIDLINEKYQSAIKRSREIYKREIDTIKSGEHSDPEKINMIQKASTKYAETLALELLMEFLSER